MNPADGAAPAAAAGLLEGRSASRPTARLLAAPQSPGLRSPGPELPGPQSPGPELPAPQPPAPRVRAVLIPGTGLAFAVMALRFGPDTAEAP